MTSSQTRNLAQTRIRFYIDESLSPEIVAQLRSHGIDCIRGPLGADDPVHLELATASGRVVCVEDDEFLKLAAKGIAHTGIINGVQHKHSIGDWVKYLLYVHAVHSAKDMINTVNYVFYVD